MEKQHFKTPEIILSYANNYFDTFYSSALIGFWFCVHIFFRQHFTNYYWIHSKLITICERPIWMMWKEYSLCLVFTFCFLLHSNIFKKWAKIIFTTNIFVLFCPRKEINKRKYEVYLRTTSILCQKAIASDWKQFRCFFLPIRCFLRMNIK